MSNLIYTDRKPSKTSNGYVFILTMVEYKDTMGGIYADEVKSLSDLINNESSIASDVFYRIYETCNNRTSYVKECWDLEEAKTFFNGLVNA